MADLIERQAVMDTVAKSALDLNDPDENWIMQDRIKEIPSAQPEPLTVNFTRAMDRETIKKLKEGLKNAPIMAVNDSAYLDLQPTCNQLATDYISRQAAIDAVCMEWCNVKHQDCKHPFDVEKDDYYWCDGCETVLRTLPDLPSAQPELGKNIMPEQPQMDRLGVKTGETCTDVISRQAAIDLWEQYHPYIATKACEYDTMLRQLPSAQPEPKWIPCSKRLPEEKDAGILKKLGTEKRSEYVLATVDVKGERMTVTACTHDGKWNWNMKYAFPDFKVVAWMPLPEPWRGEDS